MIKTEPKFELTPFMTNDWPGNVHDVRDAGVCGDDFLDLVHHLDGAGLRRGVGELHIDDEIALVLIRNEAARNHGVAEIGQAEQAGVKQQNDGAETQAPADRAAIEPGRRVEDAR